MRVIALLLVTLLIVVSGFWLARGRAVDAQAELTGATQVAAEAGEPGDAAPGEEPAAAGGDALPDGFAPVEPLTDEPRRAFEAAGEALEPGLDYVALIRTSKGDIVVDLYEDQTPVTVNNFVFLALNRFYDGVPFHRVIDGFMAQTGDPTGTGMGGPGYQFADEIVGELRFDAAGVLAMANAGPGTNGSQFFITFAATPWLDGAHTIFGHVLSGADVLDAITRVDPQQPSAIAYPDDTLADLAAQGVDLPGEDDQTVGEAIEAALGTAPVSGQSFTVAGHRGVLGAVGGQPAYGFFPQPDLIESVVVGARPAAP